MFVNSKMKVIILCLYIARIVAWPSGVYILDTYSGQIVSQYYNPLTEPHSQLNLSISFRGDSYEAAEKLVAKAKCASL